jgi:small subunit ribosomal protein S2
MSHDITLKDLLEAGVHFGHQTRKWNPKMKEYIFISRGGIHIIDLQKTLRNIDKAYQFIRDTAASGKKVLFVATKKQARIPIMEAAKAVDMPYVTERWLGGMLTNFQTVSKSIRKLEEIERVLDGPEREMLSKKETLQLERERVKLDRNLGGIREMDRLPGALFVIDTQEEETAVREARKLGIPVVGIVDTNADPDVIHYLIPGNDDAIRSIQLFTRLAKNAISDGVAARTEGAVVAEVEMEDASQESSSAGLEQSAGSDDLKVSDEKSEASKKDAADGGTTSRAGSGAAAARAGNGNEAPAEA